jgi:hypothetical protein
MRHALRDHGYHGGDRNAKAADARLASHLIRPSVMLRIS